MVIYDNNKIKKAKKLKILNPDLINEVEKTTNKNMKIYNEKSVVINNIRIEIEESISNFETIKKELNDKKVQDSLAEYYSVYAYGEFVVSIIYEKSSETMIFFEITQNNFQEDKNHANSVLTMLSNFLEATPEAFEENKKLADAISSLK